MIPVAQITHRAASRVRFRIRARRGDSEYFSRIEKYLLNYGQVRIVETNPLTGSVLLVHEGLDLGDLAKKARSDGLFMIPMVELNSVPLSAKMVAPLAKMSDFVRRLSNGELDLPGLIFLGLLGTGVYQIFRGNFGAPPWYTAFWYAFGVFTKTLMDKGAKGENTAM